MPENIVKPSGPTKASKNDAGGGVLRSEPVMAVVKNNIDPVRMGRIQVFIEDLNGPDPEDSSCWVTVGFLSPFYGRSYPNGGTGSGYGTYAANPVSYGEWHSPPEIGTRVICIFVNGDPNYGYYIGSIPEAEALTMVPAIGAIDNKVVLNAGEAKNLAGATQLPVTNLNINNADMAEGDDFLNMPKPVHSYVASTLAQQGLIRDNIRGPITSNAQRETPSRVGWGVSTPGRPIYEGGYSDETINDALKAGDGSASSTKIVSRRAGHTFVMDDGDLLGKDQLIRLRTSLGHQILMSDDGQCLFIIHANGQSYIELGKEGTIDMFSTNSVNIRTQGDLNLHADNNVNIQAKNDININADNNININSTGDYNHLVTGNYATEVLGNFGTKVDGTMSMSSAGDGSYASDATMFVNGSVVNLNTGSTSAVPQAVDPITLIAQTDTLFDDEKGFAPSPASLNTIVSRAPAHMPWAMAGQGVDVKVDLKSSASLPEAPSNEVQSATAASPALPENPASVATIATVPSVGSIGGSLNAGSTAAMVGAVASQASAVASQAVTTGTSITNGIPQVGQLAQTPGQMVTGGALKPGSDTLINGLVAKGVSVPGAMTKNLFTGQAGATSLQGFVGSTSAQIQSQVTNFSKSQTQLTSAGILKGNENPSAVAGVIVAGAQNGVAATADFIKNSSLISGVTSPAGGNGNGIAQSISSGNFAASLSSSLSGGLSGLASSLGSAFDKAKGAITSAFNSIVGGYKSFTPGVPQNLRAIASGSSTSNDSTSGITNTVANAAQNEANLAAATTGLQGLPGGLSAMAATVNNAVGAANKLPGGTAIGSLANNSAAGLMNNIPTSAASASSLLTNITSGGASAGIPGVTGGAGSLLSSVTSLLPKGLAAQLNSAISALSSSGPGAIKMPVVATNTTDRSSVTTQIGSILSNPKIPSPKYSTQVAAANYFDAENAKLEQQIQARAALKSQLHTQEALTLQLRTEYQNAIDSYPPGDPIIVDKREQYYAAKLKWAELLDKYADA